jgi:hypothetical protein
VNKSQGATAGAIVLAGILLHPFSGLSPQTSAANTAAASSSTNIQADANTGADGPWIASCNYWAPSRVNPEPPDASSISVDFASESGQIDSRVRASAATEEPCPGGQDRWGIPAPSGNVKPEITTIIALVPDPLHAHMSLDFDRSVDALLQAGADNGYIASHYWIPWKSPGSTSASPGAAETEHEHAREREPGLIVLKGARNPLGYSNAIYLFLVSDTPVLGENGSQLDLALRYEGHLQKLAAANTPSEIAAPIASPGIEVALSRAKDKRLAIIGPNTSGGAASLLAGIQHAIAERKNGNTDYPDFDRVEIAGETTTTQANSLLNPPNGVQGVKIGYTSFAGDAEFVKNTLLQSIHDSGHDTSRVALLIESGTAFGALESLSAPDLFHVVDPKNSYPPPLVIQFPHGISLLRNAHKEDQGQSGGPPAAPSPYLHLSLQDSSADDSVTHFSQQTPLSQEAQLMGIARQLKRNHIEFISISASNILDEFFLAKFLHRAVPDARLVSTGGGDLLYEHDTDDVPFVGTLALGPYNLIGSTPSNPGGPLHTFPSSSIEALYNAASYTLWKGAGDPDLADYRSIFHRSADPKDPIHPSLWVSVIGRDGYYPVGILSDCAAGSNARVLPSLARDDKEPNACAHQCTSLTNAERFKVTPSLWWFGICCFILGACIIHTACLRFANIWSPFTRDLAIDNNDEPRRRTVYVHIGTAMLFCMAVVAAYPIFPALRICWPGNAAIVLAVLTLLAGLAVLVSSWLKIRHYAFRRSTAGSRSKIRLPRWTQTEFYPLFHGIALAASIVIPALWIWICERDYSGGLHSYAGLFFSYRCLNPVSGVSAVPPILLLLFSWYWWSVIQTWRLRFSETSRPRLPGKLPGDRFPMYVSDDQLAACKGPTHAALYDNITCLLITKQVLSRFLPKVRDWKINVLLFALYLVLFALCLFGMHIETVGRIFWTHGYWWPTPLEFLVEVLLFPLLMVSLTGWLRMILIWGSLRRGLLIPLEQQPIRFAFSRLNRDGWMSMMRQGDLHERWREMARSIESMRQIVHSPDVIQAIAEVDRSSLANAYTKLEADVQSLINLVAADEAGRKHMFRPSRHQSRRAAPSDLCAEDLPTPLDGKEVEGMCQIEQDFADFAKLLLQYVLVPYWSEKRTGFVEAEELELVTARSWQVRRQPDTRDLHADPVHDIPSYIRIAEEFVAIRYVSLIRTVLVNLRRLMTFIWGAFVLSIVAWNSYPFLPREWIDAAFTALLFILGTGMVWVFAQMHRDAILSRVTKTQSNELGIDFYFRVATFGALPLLTWLAYQFPSIGNSVFKFLQPGLAVVK